MDKNFVQVLDKHLSEFSEDDQKTCKANIEKYAKDIVESAQCKINEVTSHRLFYVDRLYQCDEVSNRLSKITHDFSIYLANATLNRGGLSITKIRYRKVYGTNYIDFIITDTDHQFSYIDRILYWYQGYIGYWNIFNKFLTN